MKTPTKPIYPLRINTLPRSRCKGILSSGAKVSLPVQRYLFFRCKGIFSSGAKVSPPIINPVISCKTKPDNRLSRKYEPTFLPIAHVQLARTTFRAESRVPESVYTGQLLIINSYANRLLCTSAGGRRVCQRFLRDRTTHS